MSSSHNQLFVKYGYKNTDIKRMVRSGQIKVGSSRLMVPNPGLSEFQKNRVTRFSRFAIQYIATEAKLSAMAKTIGVSHQRMSQMVDEGVQMLIDYDFLTLPSKDVGV